MHTMLLKWIITAAIVYFLYKTFFSSGGLPGPKRERDGQLDRERPREENEGEYIDYEEVD